MSCYCDHAVLAASVVWAIRRDAKGRLWVATEGGLQMLEARTRRWRKWTRADGLASVRIVSVAIDSEGGVWAGADAGGSAGAVTHIGADGSIAGVYGYRQGLMADRIAGLAFDSAGYLWVATLGGLFRPGRPRCSAGRRHSTASARPMYQWAGWDFQWRIGTELFGCLPSTA
jgi:ligand-binding sensor domain-containing protein